MPHLLQLAAAAADSCVAVLYMYMISPPVVSVQIRGRCHRSRCHRLMLIDQNRLKWIGAFKRYRSPDDTPPEPLLLLDRYVNVI